MSRAPSDPFYANAARTCIAVLGIVASIVQLVTAPWPVGVRVAILLGLLVLAAVLLAYSYGLRRGAMPAGHHATPLDADGAAQLGSVASSLACVS